MLIRYTGQMEPGQVREALGRILGSRSFHQSERMSRFLTFCTDHVLRGEGGKLKEYVIGTAVFDRKEDYDPRMDPIVRVEARRLRAKLKEYYEGPGKHDHVLIELPVGTYAPVIRMRGQEAKRETSIAVLPFQNLGREADDEYFSDGLTEELIHALTRVQGLRVLAWPSAARLRGREEDIGGIREQLKVDVILRGSVRRAGNQVRITVQLVDAATGQYLWSESYHRRLRDLLAIQEEIAGTIVSTLKLALSPGKSMMRRFTNLECYNLCLKGRFLANQRTRDALRRSIQCYEEAVALDADCALAYSGIADGYTLLADYGLLAPGEAMLRAKAAAQRALELEPLSGEAHASMALIRSHYDWNWEESERLYLRAIELNPGYATAHYWYALDYLAVLRRFDEAFSEVEAAHRLDPLSALILEGCGYVHTLNRDYDRAIAGYQRVLDLDPTFYKAHASMGRAHAMAGRYKEALALLEKALTLAGVAPTIVAAIGQVSALAGDRLRAEGCRKMLEEIARQQHVPATCFALIHLGLGEIPAALDQIERAVENHEFAVVSMGAHPLYDPVAEEPRFQQALRRVGLSR